MKYYIVSVLAIPTQKEAQKEAYKHYLATYSFDDAVSERSMQKTILADIEHQIQTTKYGWDVHVVQMDIQELQASGLPIKILE